MARASRPEDGRFVSAASDLLVKESGVLKGNADIIRAITKSTSADIPTLMQGLAQERRLDRTLHAVWIAAEDWYNRDKETMPIYQQQGVDRELHIALIAYVLNLFFEKFNKTTREVRSISDVKNYPYKNFFKLLLLAVMRVKGQPYVLPTDIKLYRGMTGHVNAWVGSEVALQQFASTSRSLQTALAYAGRGKRTLLVIEHIMASGRDTANLLRMRHNPNTICLDHIADKNQECLIWPCEAFKVTAVVDKEDGLRVIYLKA